MEKLICDCKDELGNPINGVQVQYVDANGETIIECTVCERFLKFTEPQPEISTKPDQE